MNAARVGLLAGFAVTVPVAVWMLGTAAGDPWASGFAKGGVRALFVATAIVASAVLPICALRLAGRALAVATACLLLVPLPLIVLLWLAGAAEVMVLVAGFGVLALYSLVILLISKATGRAMADSFARALTLAALQVGGAVAVFVSRDVWLGWLGL